VTDADRYAIGDLAELGGVSRRTVRYYVQEGLLPAPLGVGRGNHYGAEHLHQLLHVKKMQEAGRTLDEIRASLQNDPSRRLKTPKRHEASVERTLWRRIGLAPGVELHVSSAVHLPSPSRLAELASWCHIHLPAHEKENADD
jgi:DNA-binding transcriptional MerR regulator